MTHTFYQYDFEPHGKLSVIKQLPNGESNIYECHLIRPKCIQKGVAAIPEWRIGSLPIGAQIRTDKRPGVTSGSEDSAGEREWAGQAQRHGGYPARAPRSSPRNRRPPDGHYSPCCPSASAAPTAASTWALVTPAVTSAWAPSPSSLASTPSSMCPVLMASWP